MIGDPFLNHRFFWVVVLFYGIIAIHDIDAARAPHKTATSKLDNISEDPGPDK
jgi:hypothetical protein